MNSIELISNLYKPYRITKKMKCTIIESMDGTFVIKPKNDKRLREVFDYLDLRGFYNHPKIIDDTRDEVNLFEYIEDSDYPKEQKSIDMIKVVASLHSKTCYTKAITEDKYKEIYNNIKNNLEYYKDEYSKLATNIEEEVFMRPSHYLFIRNYSKFNNQISFCENELDKWYESVKNKKEIRLSTIHNNLSLSHFCKKDLEALISWDNVEQDTPILDIYKLYKNEGSNLNFKSVLSSYLDAFPLEDDELKLLLILLAMPQDIEFCESEIESCKKLSKVIDMVYNKEELIRPYYLVDDKIEKEKLD